MEQVWSHEKQCETELWQNARTNGPCGFFPEASSSTRIRALVVRAYSGPSGAMTSVMTVNTKRKSCVVFNVDTALML